MTRVHRSALLTLASTLIAAVATGETRSRPMALKIEEGSVARSQVVAVGRDLEVAGEAAADVVAINGTARVGGRIVGDLIVLGGDALLGSAARVEGDVFVLGGRLEAERGARIDGRSVSYPTISSAWLTLIEGPSLGMSPTSPVVLGAKLALLAAWLTLTLVLLATSGRGILSTSEQVRIEPLRNFFVGLTAVLALTMTGLFFSAFAGAVVGVPLLVLVVLLALMLKLWGMVAVFHAVGEWVGVHLLRRRLLALNCALVGLLVLGSIKLIPWIGTWVWTVATFIAVGASLSSKFGRREPWFDLEPDLSRQSL
jgi:hypothetical protein